MSDEDAAAKFTRWINVVTAVTAAMNESCAGFDGMADVLTNGDTPPDPKRDAKLIELVPSGSIACRDAAKTALALAKSLNRLDRALWVHTVARSMPAENLPSGQ